MKATDMSNKTKHAHKVRTKQNTNKQVQKTTQNKQEQHNPNQNETSPNKNIEGKTNQVVT